MRMLSRRMFLRGAGGALVAIPPLSSLLPRSVRSQPAAVPVRYVQWVTNHGQYPENFWPARNDANMLVDVGAGVRARPLDAFEGPLSMVLDSAFDPLRSKLNLIRGLDVIKSASLHNASAPTCASANQGSSDGGPCDTHTCFRFKHSADVVMEDFSGLYAQPVRSRALRLTPGLASSSKWGSFSWRDGDRVFAPDTSEGAMREVFGDEPGSAPALGPSPADQRRLDLTDDVIEDYRQVVTSPGLSSLDRQRLQDYMDLLADVQRPLRIPASTGCSPPALDPESSFDDLHRNAVNITTAALACQATRVVAYHCFHVSSSEMMRATHHEWAHNAGDSDLHGGMMRYRYRQLAQLISNLDALIDVDGNTVLDNTVVYAGNELSGGGDHGLDNMPLLTAGGAGGRLRTGQYIDYGGRPLNNLLITLFQVMGLGPSDYERNGQAGFGDYEIGGNSAKYRQYHDTDARRRAPLPYLYLG